MPNRTLPSLRVALVQCGDGDRVERHVALLRAHADCDLVVFPELSLTGYVDADAPERAVALNDPAFGRIQQACDEGGVTAAVGAPLRFGRGLYIATVFMRPYASPEWYAKRHLHVDEAPFFTLGSRPPVAYVGDHVLGLGICYESTLDTHLADVFARDVDAYVVSAAKSAEATSRAHVEFPKIAAIRGVPVLFSNDVGPAQGFTCGGRSAWWDARGACVEALGECAPGVLIAPKVQG